MPDSWCRGQISRNSVHRGVSGAFRTAKLKDASPWKSDMVEAQGSDVIGISEEAGYRSKRTSVATYE